MALEPGVHLPVLRNYMMSASPLTAAVGTHSTHSMSPCTDPQVQAARSKQPGPSKHPVPSTNLIKIDLRVSRYLDAI